MSAISEYAARQNDYNTRQEAATDDLASDVTFLNDTIKKLQESAGTVTPEDQQLLDQLEARGKTVAEKLEALAALTPPAVPV